MGILKFKNPEVQEGLTVANIEAMRARGYDIYVYRNGKNIFINSNNWNEEKENRLYKEYGLQTFREHSGDENLVVYDPKFFEKTDKLWFNEKNLVYCGPDEGEVKFPINCSSMRSMFSTLLDCEVDFSECNLSCISCIEEAFEMSSVKKVLFGKQNCYKINKFEKVFRNCVYLELVDLSRVLLPNVMSISQCFSGCGSLKNCNIGKVCMPKLDVIDNCFEACMKLISVECSNWDCTITHAASAFDSCYSLQNVSMPNVVFDGGRFFNRMFRYSSNLINFNFKEFNLDDTESNSNDANNSMFRGCTKLRDKFGCILAREVLDCFKAEKKDSKELSVINLFN